MHDDGDTKFCLSVSLFFQAGDEKSHARLLDAISSLDGNKRSELPLIHLASYSSCCEFKVQSASNVSVLFSFLWS